MKSFLRLTALVLLLHSVSVAQTNIHFLDSTALNVLLGNYNPADYAASNVLSHPDSITSAIINEISPDTLFQDLLKLSAFGNRNTGSDTVSSTWGIGAARRWAYSRFKDYSSRNENRLIVTYLEFNRLTCGMNTHRDVVAILPGTDTSLTEGFILIEGHMDSRCNNGCDTSCIAQGADDNGSGSVLVLEMARVLSRFSFNRTIVFMLTTGEEQGLYGAEAMSDFCTQNQVPVMAVLNNDIVGGIYCGQTASPPGCPGEGDVDSLNLRIYSYGGYNSKHKQLALFTKLEYQEMIKAFVPVPMSVNIMSAEDRTGRGGDHIPFRQAGKRSIRFTSANEHGNGNPIGSYQDRQHTSWDSIGVDLDNNGTIDSFYVDFNYLARNVQINANAASMIGIGPETPSSFSLTAVPGGVQVEILSGTQYDFFRIGLRTTTNDWDSVYTMAGTIDTITNLPTGIALIFSVASVDSNGIESLFSYEENLILAAADGFAPRKQVNLIGNHPNPFDEQTIISVNVTGTVAYKEAFIRITDAEGREVQKTPVTLREGMNEILFNHGFHAAGMYYYTLVIDGEVIETRKMVMTP